MQGGTLQEQFCQTQQYPHRVQRRSFIHPVTDKLLPLKAPPYSIVHFCILYGAKMLFSCRLYRRLSADLKDIILPLPKTVMDFQFHLPLSPSLLAPTVMSLSPSQTPGEER